MKAASKKAIPGLPRNIKCGYESRNSITAIPLF